MGQDLWPNDTWWAMRSLWCGRPLLPRTFLGTSACKQFKHLKKTFDANGIQPRNASIRRDSILRLHRSSIFAFPYVLCLILLTRPPITSSLYMYLLSRYILPMDTTTSRLCPRNWYISRADAQSITQLPPSRWWLPSTWEIHIGAQMGEGAGRRSWASTWHLF